MSDYPIELKKEIEHREGEVLPLEEKVSHPIGDLNHLDAANTAGGLVTHAQMKLSLDELPVWQAVRAYKKMCTLCFIAAASAALDGYQINLSGGIVANKGFILQMSGNGANVIPGQYVSAWGGIQSAGQFFGQVSLPPVTDKFGRKVAFYVMWVVLTASVLCETLSKNWWSWLIAKLLAGTGIGMVQGTLPMYISELAPTQLKGALINAYTFWFVVGQLMAAIALNELNASHPLDFRVAILTQWAMLGALAIVFVFIPESPWWLVGKGRYIDAQNVLERYNGNVPGYSSHQHVAIMTATIEEEEKVASETGMIGAFAVIKGTNGWRLLIASWPKFCQQFVGLSVFNTYSTYFFQLAGNKNPFLVTVILGCVQLLSMILTVATTDSIGRRPLTVYGYSVTVLAVLALGIVGCFDYQSPELGSLLIFFSCLATFTTTASSAIGYAYLSEIPTQQLRAKTASWGLALSNLIAIMFSFTVPIMLKGTSGGSFKGWGVKTGFFFAGTGLPSVVIAWFILPEVSRRTPAEIDEMFDKKVHPRKFKGYVTDVQYDLAARERNAGTAPEMSQAA